MNKPAATAKPPGEIELQKLQFEREKQALEERWKHRTFGWTIASTILGSAVAVAIALIGTSSKGDASSKNGGASAVENCRLSLQRLPTLAMQENQTVANLRDAITRHVGDCDAVLRKL